MLIYHDTAFDMLWTCDFQVVCQEMNSYKILTLFYICNKDDFGHGFVLSFTKDEVEKQELWNNAQILCMRCVDSYRNYRSFGCCQVSFSY